MHLPHIARAPGAASVSAPAREMAQFSDLLHGVYAASAEPQRWHEAVAAIAGAMKAVQAMLFTPCLGPANGGFFYPWQIRQEDLIRDGTRYAAHDIWASNARRKGFMREGVVFAGAPGLPSTVLSIYRGLDEPFGPGRARRVCRQL